MSSQVLNPHYHGTPLGTGIANDVVEINPSDDAEQFPSIAGKQTVAIGIKCVGAGNLVIQPGWDVDEDGPRRTIPVSAGEYVPVSVRRVYAATTATGIYGFLVRQER